MNISGLMLTYILPQVNCAARPINSHQLIKSRLPVAFLVSNFRNQMTLYRRHCQLPLLSSLHHHSAPEQSLAGVVVIYILNFDIIIFIIISAPFLSFAFYFYYLLCFVCSLLTTEVVHICGLVSSVWKIIIIILYFDFH